MFKCNMCLFSVIVVCSVVCVTCFNVDTVNYAQYRGESNSMFGFSVAVHKEAEHSWLLVGAPEAQSQVQHNVTKGGVVYRCDTRSDNACAEVPFDRNGNNGYQSKAIDQKDNQWFGATLQSAGESGPIVACAPRYVWFTRNGERREPVGTCYVAKDNFAQYLEFSPCRTGRYGYHLQGSCQAGMSAAITKDGKRLFIGAPGSWYWQGQGYSVDANAIFPFTPGVFGDQIFGGGKVVQQSLETRPAVVSTSESPSEYDDSYLGYSVTVGYFTGDTRHQGAAVGMPRGANLLGKITLCSWNLTIYQNITGEQLGAYFGYSLATSDVDGDGLDDLVVGAPLHTEPNSEGKYEVGRVYVYFQGGSRRGRFARVGKIEGFKSKSRFGLSVASLGDINLDNYGDFVVGAPYDGPNENGAVYIYHGSRNGLRQKYSQVIYAEDVSRSISTFGFSVSGGMDLDGNDYPDMSVGAYSSNAAFFFRSRPVINLEATARYISSNREIFLEQYNCSHRNQDALCMHVQFCGVYTGTGIPEYIQLLLQFELDAKKSYSSKRMFFKTDDSSTLNETVTLYKGHRNCLEKYVYVKSEIRDKLTPLELKVQYFLDERSASQYRRDPRSILKPIINRNIQTFANDSISIYKNCGPDNVCIPDLELKVAPNVQRYLLKSETPHPLELDVRILNNGEDAYESTFYIVLPPAIELTNVKEGDTTVRISCSEIGNRTTRCDIGNPLPANKSASFIISLHPPSNLEGVTNRYEFEMWVNTSNPEEKYTVGNNRKHLSVDIYIDATIELRGASRPEDVHYDVSSQQDETVVHDRDVVTHIYSIINQGPAAINEAEITYIWPYALLNGEDLLYLLAQPIISGNVPVRCSTAPANYKNYKIDYNSISKSEAHTFTAEGKQTSEEGGDGYGTPYQESGSSSSSRKNFHSGESTGSIYTESRKHSSGTSGKTESFHYNRVGHGGSAERTGTSQYDSSETSNVGRGEQVGGTLDGTETSRSDKTSISYGGTEQQTGGRTETVHFGGADTSYDGYGESGQGGSTIHRTETSQYGSYGGSNQQAGGTAGRSETPLYDRKETSSNGRGGQHGGGTVHRTETTYETSSGGIQPTSGTTTIVNKTTIIRYDNYPGPVHTEQVEQGGTDIYSGGRRQYVGGNREYAGESREFGGGSSSSATFHSNSGSASGEEIDSSRYGHEQHVVRTNGEVPVIEESYGKRVHGQNGSAHFGWNEQSGESQDRYGQNQGSYSRNQNQFNYRQDHESQDPYYYEESHRESGGSRNQDGYYAGGSGYQQSSSNRSYGQSDNRNIGVADIASQSGFRTGVLGVGDYVTINEGISQGNYPGLGVYDPDESRHLQDSRNYDSGQRHSAGSYSRTYMKTRSFTETPGRDNVATDAPDPNTNFLGRHTREVHEESYFDLERIKQCKAARCHNIKCTLGPMLKENEVVIEFKYRVSFKTLRNISISQPIQLSSMMFARITKFKNKVIDQDMPVISHEVSTKIEAPKPDIEPVVAKLWVIVLSAVAGTLILLLLVFLLYKCGFFTRKRPSDAAERQPLNRNGYHHGDEAL